MAKVYIQDGKSLVWRKVRDIVDQPTFDRLSEKELESRVGYHKLGQPHQLQIFELDYLPGVQIELHAHDADEIVYIMSGSIILGSNRSYGVGTSIFIEAATLYGFTAGSEGLRMLNFRSVDDHSFWRKSDFLKKRAALRT